MLLVSWRRWVSIIADSGRELDLPLRLLNGETLYRDVHYLYTPLAPYLNARLYGWFGVRLETLQVSGVICSLLIVWLGYRIARHLLSPAASALAVCGIIIWCIFKPAGNLISPYSYAALYGMLCALACLAVCLHNQRQQNLRWLALAGFLLALSVLFKQEFALVAGAAILATAWQARATKRHAFATSLLAAGIGCLPLLGVTLGSLFAQHGWTLLVNDCHLFFTHLPDSLRYYNAHRTGLNAPWASLMQMLGGTCVAAALTCLIVCLSVKPMVALKRHVVWVGLSALGLAGMIALASRGQWDGSPLRALPLFLLATLWLTRRGATHPHNPALFVIAAYSLAALLRVILRVPSGGAFGSFFLPTSLILLVYALLHSLPAAIAEWSQTAPSAVAAKRCGWTLLLIALVITAIVFGVRYRRNYNVLIQSARGTFYAPRKAGAAYAETLAWLREHAQAGEPIAVLPEGSDLAFFSGLPMPLRHQIFIPGLVSEADERRVIEQLPQIRYVLIVNRPLREFGATAFGQDFYPRLGDWLAVHYRVAQVCGAPNEAALAIGDSRFFIKILERLTP